MTSSKSSGTPPSEPETLIVGTLVGPHGIKGEVKLRPLTEFPERLAKLRRLLVRLPDGTENWRTVKGSRFNREMLLLKFEGVNDRDAAEALRGATALIDRSEAAPLPEGRFYEHQILGLRVVTPEGEELGTITDIMETASNDVYVAGKYLIPATHDAVLRLAPDEGVLVVRSKEYLEGEEVR